jgi:hypothetical protein
MGKLNQKDFCSMVQMLLLMVKNTDAILVTLSGQKMELPVDILVNKSSNYWMNLMLITL